MMNQEQYMSIVRHVLQAAGTVTTTLGIMNDGVWTSISGAVLMLAPVAWGIYERRVAGIVASADKLIQDPNVPVVGNITIVPSQLTEK